VGRTFLGEFEQRVLLAALRCGDQAFALDVRREIEGTTGQVVSRGAFYTTLDRLAAKDLVAWTLVPGGPGRDGQPKRLLRVTAAGVQELRASRRTLERLWQGLDAVFGED
jgi:DNA-binding PadR family transcriptional regulator